MGLSHFGSTAVAPRAVVMHKPMVMRRPAVARSIGMPMLGRFQVPVHQRPATAVAYDLHIAHSVTLAASPLRNINGPMAPMGGAVTRRDVPMRPGAVARRHTVMSPRMMIGVDARRRRRNERRGQL